MIARVYVYDRRSVLYFDYGRKNAIDITLGTCKGCYLAVA